MNRRQISAVSAVFVFALLISLVLNLPVRQLIRFAELPQGLNVQGLDGTVRHATVEQVSFQGLFVQDISIKLRPLCLTLASLCYDAVSSDDSLQVRAEMNLVTGNIRVNNSRVALPENILDRFPGLIVKPSGQFNLQVERLDMSDSTITDLNALLIWDNAGIQGEEQVLGNYDARFTRRTDGLHVQIGNRESLLSITGEATVSPQGAYAVDVEMTGSPALNAAVSSALEVIAKKSGLNRYELKRSGQLAPEMAAILNRILDPGQPIS